MGLVMRSLWRCTPSWLRERVAPPFAIRSYSQEGEDRVLAHVLDIGRRDPGFYVDVGAHHPQRFSNTYAFYLAGWRGLNIEPRPGSLSLFQRLRPRDINLNLADR
jgi:hypothetical protein